ncbi:MAG: MarR family winged helix-turn-helix transcriptional regulator [Roseburia sp.]
MNNEKSIEKALILNLRDLGHTVRNLYEGKGSQKRVLILLKESEGMTQAQLTERLGIRQGSASEVIRKLDQAGFIRRTKNKSDKRTVDIHLTEEGQEAAESAVQQRKQRHKEMFACLTEQEKEELLHLTEKLNRDWEQRYSSRKQEGEH